MKRQRFLMFFFRLLSRLPFWWLYRLADVLYFFLAHVVQYRRQVIDENLARAFPARSVAERRTIRRNFYRNIADVIVEVIKVATISASELRRRVHYTNPDVVGSLLARGQVVAILTAHQANWEWLPLSGVLNGFPSDTVYKPLSNPFFEALMRAVRGRFGVTLVPAQRLGRAIASRRNEPRVIGFAADQMPNQPEFAFWTDFFGQDTAFYPGPERLARSAGMPAVYAELVRVGRGHYEITFTLLGEPPYADLPENALLLRYRDALEATIRRHPSDWLWSHKRWKHQREKYAEFIATGKWRKAAG